MSNEEIVKSLVSLEEDMEKMREEGDTDLRSLINKVEWIIMSIEK